MPRCLMVCLIPLMYGAQWRTLLHAHRCTPQAQRKKAFDKEQAAKAEGEALLLDALGGLQLGGWPGVC